ncbi:hypothetical protein SDC9_77243 [bioreactor metagenome]|uniref:Uncharacterized protein n=1 Tax=bioreactor metagenome TaxID=1076179 RepID=A0A644YW73_9ZZZZ
MGRLLAHSSDIGMPVSTFRGPLYVEGSGVAVAVTAAVGSEDGDALAWVGAGFPQAESTRNRTTGSRKRGARSFFCFISFPPFVLTGNMIPPKVLPCQLPLVLEKDSVYNVKKEI